VREPGLDRHEWQTEWEGLEEDLADSPVQALPAVGDLIERMVREHGWPIDDEVADDGIEPDLLARFREAREVTNQVEHGDDFDLGDVGQAIHTYRDIYEQLIDQPDPI
jgi:hypothetical protein